MPACPQKPPERPDIIAGSPSARCSFRAYHGRAPARAGNRGDHREKSDGSHEEGNTEANLSNRKCASTISDRPIRDSLDKIRGIGEGPCHSIAVWDPAHGDAIAALGFQG